MWHSYVDMNNSAGMLCRTTAGEMTKAARYQQYIQNDRWVCLLVQTSRIDTQRHSK